MKKILTLIAVVAMIGSMSSCKKTFQCDCSTLGVYTETKEGKGKTAQEACDDVEEKFLGVSLEDCVPQ
jgi:hypothetical protein